MGLIARGLEEAGIATTLTSWNAGRTRVTRPPRATFTKLKRGASMGAPGDAAQQMRILRATLGLLSQPAPQNPVQLDESMD